MSTTKGRPELYDKLNVELPNVNTEWRKMKRVLSLTQPVAGTFFQQILQFLKRGFFVTMGATVLMSTPSRLENSELDRRSKNNKVAVITGQYSAWGIKISIPTSAVKLKQVKQNQVRPEASVKCFLKEVRQQPLFDVQRQNKEKFTSEPTTPDSNRRLPSSLEFVEPADSTENVEEDRGPAQVESKAPINNKKASRSRSTKSLLKTAGRGFVFQTGLGSKTYSLATVGAGFRFPIGGFIDEPDLFYGKDYAQLSNSIFLPVTRWLELGVSIGLRLDREVIGLEQSSFKIADSSIKGGYVIIKQTTYKPSALSTVSRVIAEAPEVGVSARIKYQHLFIGFSYYNLLNRRNPDGTLPRSTLRGSVGWFLH